VWWLPAVVAHNAEQLIDAALESGCTAFVCYRVSGPVVQRPRGLPQCHGGGGHEDQLAVHRSLVTRIMDACESLRNERTIQRFK
jgi:hypothetical protein